MAECKPSMEIMYKRYELGKQKNIFLVNSVLFLIALAALFLPGEIKYYVLGVILVTYIYRKYV